MEPQDIKIGELHSEDVGRPFLRGQKSMPIEASPYTDEPISKYEESAGIPYTAVRLGYGEKIALDPHVEMKVRAIDEYIQDQMKAGGSRDSRIGYETVFRKMMEGLGESPEGAKNHGTMSKILDSLFRQVAFSNGMSSKSYLESYTNKNNTNKINGMLRQLGSVLTTLKSNQLINK